MNTINRPEDEGFRVLAKSDPEISLRQHIDDCLSIYEQLKVCVPNLPIKNDFDFWELLKVSIIFHDMGKSHPDFQKMLRNIRNSWNTQRHELFSLYFINQLDLSEEQKDLVVFTVLGHHKDLNELYSIVDKKYGTRTYDGFDLGFLSGLNFGEECGKLNESEVWQIADSYGFKKIIEGPIDIYRLLKGKINRNKTTEKNYFTKLLLVGAMKQCDHLASAGINQIQKVEEEDFSFLYQFPHYHHQQRANNTVDNVILAAPTGSGKTETAFLWLKKQIETKGQGRIFYILPYTASINAMYERLNKNINSTVPKVGMIHGKLAQYIEKKMSEDDSLKGDRDKKQLIEDFKTLVTPIKITTPFQLLKHIFGLKGFEKGLFEWTGGYFVFDEIHAYDARVFAQIIVLVEFATKYLGVKALIMTATLPTFMKREIEKAIGSFTSITADEQLYNSFTRHRVILEDGLLSDSLSEIQEEINGGKKVLVVCNTVEQSQIVFQSLECNNKLLIHGSFNADDRFEKEKRLMKEEIQLLVGTQAIEVSLDIDFSIIYTEPAPLDALIQRFGRVNRKREKGICPCIVFKERNSKDKYIYRDEDVIQRTIDELQTVMDDNDGIIYEIELQQMIDRVYPDWSTDAKRDFDEIKLLLSYSLANELLPLVNSPEREEQFYEQFDGKKVLPISLKSEYEKRLSNNEFIKADSLLVSVRESRFIGMLKSGEISRNDFFFELKGKEKLYDKTTYVIKRKYDSDLGLCVNEFEDYSFDEVGF